MSRPNRKGNRRSQSSRNGRRHAAGYGAPTLGGVVTGSLDDAGGKGPGGSVAPVTAKTFDDLVLFSPVPVVVDFWADWCGPCRMMKPILAELAAAHPAIRFVSVDVMKQKQLADEYRVQAVPTFLVFVRGRQVAKFSGAKPKHKFLAQVEAAIEKAGG